MPRNAPYYTYHHSYSHDTIDCRDITLHSKLTITEGKGIHEDTYLSLGMIDDLELMRQGVLLGMMPNEGGKMMVKDLGKVKDSEVVPPTNDDTIQEIDTIF